MCDRMEYRANSDTLCMPPRMVREFAAVHNTTQIRKLLTVLGRDFAQSKNANYKKGGLIGLAAMAIALGKVSIQIVPSFWHRVVESLNVLKLFCRILRCSLKTS